MSASITQFRLALSFLTTLPAGSFSTEVPDETLGRTQAWFPLVGLLLGLILFFSARFFLLFTTPAISAALLLIVHFMLTGGFHLDGLADTADGLMSGKTEKEKIFSIMKDSYLGSMGAVALTLLLLLKYSTLSVIIGKAPATLVIFPILGRYAIVQLTYTNNYARPEGGLGAIFTNHCGLRELLVAGSISLATGLLFAGFRGLLCCLGLVFYGLIIKYAAQRRLGGVTGDILGYACESGEALVLVILAAAS
ncbi:MAG: adenosylcobinamide-GDP ribazoletransferase [Deltaproteobacteria bacterium]|nr:adenosylcobinamide-GDP ribazoletransferase [Deltaproteobacteria bacterium]